VQAAAGKPVEFHSNNLMGTSGLAYIEAAQLGIHVLHTACRSMANGPSVPSVESVVRNLEMLGYTHSIDRSLFAPVTEHFRAVGHAAGYLVDAVSEYDLFNVTHQVPGGMLGTLRAQLEQHGMAARIEEVLAETGNVRRELGWPVMATPLSQLVGTQAVLNIVTGDRYSMVPDELVNYALGRYGEPPAPIDPEVRDRLLHSKRAAEIAATPPDEPTLEELRKRYGTNDDDLLILRALIPEEDIAAMQASGPPRRDYPLGSREVEEIRTLMAIARAPYVHIANARFELELRR
jgi:oxaloacetate decarboxylase alpha subunit